MDQEDVNRVLNQLWIQNRVEVENWIYEQVVTERTLCRAEKAISDLERAKVLK